MTHAHSPVVALTIAVDAVLKAVACYADHATSPERYAVEVALRMLDDTQNAHMAHSALTKAVDQIHTRAPLETSMDACLCHLVRLALEHPSFAGRM